MSLCCFSCCRCCKKQTNYLKDIDTTTRLLPENKNSKLNLKETKIIVFGKIYPESNKESIELNKNLVRKITIGNEHLLILFNDGTLYALGKNNYGQLGLKLTKDNNSFNEIKQLVLNNSVLEKLKISKYDVSDIACGDNFSLVLITFGSNSAIIRFGIKEEDKYKDNFEQANTVVSNLL
jgi:alpha-tubulin suppressor-like RCC1 family protein